MAERHDENPRDPREGDSRSRTDRGYDEAAHRGPSRYGRYEGRGGVFGTTGGGSYQEGFQTREAPALDGEDYGSPFEPVIRNRDLVYSPSGLPWSEVSFSERGPHTGRGPKGYERADDRIREDVCDRLWLDGRVDASDMEVAVESGEVTLSGTVSDRSMKRQAADVAEDVAGVRDVFNNLRVDRSGQN